MKMQKLLVVILFLFSFDIYNSNAQDLINIYKQNYDNVNTSDLIFTPYTGSTGWEEYDPTSYFSHQNTYNGEYQILLNRFFPWVYRIPPSDPSYPPLFTSDAINEAHHLGLFLVTYKIEAVSFPFYCPCAFDESVNPVTGGCAGAGGATPERIMKVPDDNNLDGSGLFWQFFPALPFSENKLLRYVEKPFDNGVFTEPSDLVSGDFCHDAGFPIGNDVFPHTILKHTVSILAGTNINASPVISSFSFLVDPTRGRLREYPYYDSNPVNSGPDRVHYDICIVPEIWSITDGNPYTGGWLDSYHSYGSTDNCEFYNFQEIGSNSCPNSGDPDAKGGTIDYSLFSLTTDDNCALASTDYNDVKVGSLSVPYSIGNKIQKIPLPPYTFVVSTFPRSDDGKTFSGYSTDGTSLSALNIAPIVHHYEIDKNINLENINQTEKIIYNPSEVFITSGANHLNFPTNYTFKTIRATYPYDNEVAAYDNAANGGPYTEKKDVPVLTDLGVDYHDTFGYPTNDPKYSSVYHLESGSKIFIESCVKLFDCTFDVQSGSELIFKHWSTNQVNVNRYGMLLNGGKLTKADPHFYFQNKTETEKILEFQSGSTIEAGSYVDVGTTSGPYNVVPNADVTFVANDEITLSDGFTAQTGSEFDAYISPVIIPLCGEHRSSNQSSNTNNDKKAHADVNRIAYANISPNPTSQNTEIKFGVTSSRHLYLKIFDSYGREIKTIINNIEFKAGSYVYNFDASILNPGVYYCKLLSEGEEKTMKLIKIN